MTRTVAVTGARGFIGAAAVRRLAGVPDARVVALARSRPTDAAANVHWIQSPLEGLRPSHWQRAGATTLDAIVHLAAFTPRSAADRDRAEEIISSNIVGLQTLLASLPSPPRRFVFCSTLDVYSRRAFDEVVNEQSPTGPVGLYGLSKLFGEGLAESYARSTGTEHVTLRIGHVYGPGEEHYAKLVPETIRRLRTGRPPRIAGDGSARRDLLYVEDVAEALVRSCIATLNGVHVMNIARGKSHTVLEIVETIAELFGYRGSLEQSPQTDAFSTAFDTSTMTRLLGSWAFVPLAEGLKCEIAQFRATS